MPKKKATKKRVAYTPKVKGTGNTGGVTVQGPKWRGGYDSYNTSFDYKGGAYGIMYTGCRHFNASKAWFKSMILFFETCMEVMDYKVTVTVKDKAGKVVKL